MYTYYCSRCGTKYHTQTQIKYLENCPECNFMFPKETKKTFGLRKARTDLKPESHKRKMNRERVRRHRKKKTIQQINVQI